MRRCSVIRRALAAALVASVASCSDAATGLSSGRGVARDEASGLEHRVTLIPSVPSAGGEVEIHSVITNRGTESVTVSSRICGLDYGGTLKLAFPNGSASCGAIGVGGPLAPGESRTNTDLNRIASALGVYSLRVRHAVQPELWVEVPVIVRGR